MDLTSLCVMLVIGCLYWLFARKSAEYLLDTKGMREKCNPYTYKAIPESAVSTDEHEMIKRNREECKEARDKYENKRAAMLVVLGLVGLGLGIYGGSRYTDANVPTYGLAVGGGFVMMEFMAVNWMYLDDGYRLLLIGGALASLIYVGSKMRD